VDGPQTESASTPIPFHGPARNQTRGGHGKSQPGPSWMMSGLIARLSPPCLYEIPFYIHTGFLSGVPISNTETSAVKSSGCGSGRSGSGVCSLYTSHTPTGRPEISAARRGISFYFQSWPSSSSRIPVCQSGDAGATPAGRPNFPRRMPRPADCNPAVTPTGRKRPVAHYHHPPPFPYPLWAEIDIDRREWE
jgi:hypothetical protein